MVIKQKLADYANWNWEAREQTRTRILKETLQNKENIEVLLLIRLSVNFLTAGLEKIPLFEQTAVSYQ